MGPLSEYSTAQYGTAQYGALPDYGVKKELLKRRARKANLAFLCMNLFLPVLIFATVYGLSCFGVRYTTPGLMYSSIVLATLGDIYLGYLAYKAMKRRMDFGSSGDDPSMVGWLFVCFLSCTLALILAVVFGDLNYWYNTQPYYDANNLEYYPDVDPSKMHGQQVMDAGRVSFVNSSKLDLKKSMSFKNLDWYCVVPISNDNTSTEFDFWAVGMNCCSGLASSFQCGEFSNTEAKGGLRLMRDDQRPFYRLAVEQAETAYQITAPHPVFFYWLSDPMAELKSYGDDGFKYYVLGVFTYFAFSLFVTIISTIVLSKFMV